MNLKKLYASLLFCFVIISPSTAQELVNLVLFGDKGVTENIKEATSFIAVKSYPGNIFERLDYKLGGPLIKLRTYSDSTLTLLHGKYIEYDEQGNKFLEGEYSFNKKQGRWSYHNDTGKVLLTRLYEDDKLINTEEPDTIPKKEQLSYADEKEATYQSGHADWSMYVMKALQPDISSKSKKGGKVRVQFVIDTTGKATQIYLRKSAEFVLDEECLRVIYNSPLWQPAFQNGRRVKAYRTQPFTFLAPDE